MDVASLQVIIQTKGVDAAQRELDKLSGTAGKAEKSVGGLSSSIKALGTVATIGAVVSLGKEAIKMADSMTIIDSRIRLVTKSLEEQTKAHKELFSIAQQTRLGFKETADLYSRIAISTKDYNISQDKLLSITQTINKAMIVSGGTAESMNSAIIQLGQAFSSNFQSVGQELQSIREQTPALYQAIVAGSGMTSKAFKKAAEDGELSTEIIIKALEKQAKKIDNDFGKINKTVGQSMTLMSNSMMAFIGEVDKSTGASGALADTISDISSNIDDLTKSMKSSNGVLDELTKKANIKLEEDGILSSILKVNQGAGDALYAVLAETLNIVDKTAGEWSKIIDSSYRGMGMWVESVGISLGVVEEKAKNTQKAINSIIPSRPSNDDSFSIVEDMEDRFTRSTELTKAHYEYLYKKEENKFKDSIKLSEDWAKRKIELATETAIAEQEEMSKPYILLQAQYEADLKEFGSQKGAKEELERNYQAELQKLNQETVKKFEEGLEKEAKKSAEWQVKMLEANEKYNDEIIKLQDDMYGTDSSIDAWYNNQLEYLGKLSQEAGATAEELQTLLDKIETLKAMKLQKQTISFKVEQSFYSSFENNLADSIEDAFNGTLNFKKFFRNIGNDLMKTFSSSLAGVGSSMLRGNYSAGLMALGSSSIAGASVSADDISGIMNAGGVFNEATNSITTAGGTILQLGLNGGGTVSSAGSDAMSLISSISTLKTAYTVATEGLSGYFSSMTGAIDSGLGFFGMGGSVGGGAMFINPLTGTAMSTATSGAFINPATLTAQSTLSSGGVAAQGASYGTIAGGALVGGAVGYGVGSGLDSMFGAKTYAPVTGAIGGAALGGYAAMAGGLSAIPVVGWIAGAVLLVIGGAIGKKVKKDAGLYFSEMSTSDNVFDAVSMYEDWQKKSWFSSKSWTNNIELSSKEKKQIENIFNTYDYLLTQLGENDRIFLEAGKYTGGTFADKLSKNFISIFTDIPQQVMAFDEIYQAWVDYAEAVDTTVMEAFTQTISGFIQSKRTFEIWSLGDSIEALAKKAEFANADLSLMQESMGATSVTVESFLSDFDKAVKENFTPETISQWESLGNALMTATDASTAYKNALNSTNEAIRQSALSILGQQLTYWIVALGDIQIAIDKFNPTFKSFSELSQTVITLENYKDSIDSLNISLENEISILTNLANERIENLNLEKTFFNSLSDYIDELTYKIIGYSATTSSYFFNELANAKALMSSGIIPNIAPLTQSASSYLEKTLNRSTSQLEYFREVAKVRSGISELGTTVTGGSLEGIENAIAQEEATLASQLQTLNDTAIAILTTWKGQAVTNIAETTTKYNNINNDIVGQAYSEVLGRTADSEGYAYWTNQVANGNIDASNIKEAISTAALTFDKSNYTGNVSDSVLDESTKNASIWINGSHSTGLDYVPYDGYIAQLHKGEKVQTASEVQKDTIIVELQNSLKDLKDMFIKNIAETSRMSRVITRLDDNDALLVRVVV